MRMVKETGRAISSVHLSDFRSLSYLLDKQATEEVKHSITGRMTFVAQKEIFFKFLFI